MNIPFVKNTPTTVDGIMSVFSDTMQKLQEHSQNMDAAIEELEVDRALIETDINECKQEAQRARAVAASLGEIMYVPSNTSDA